MPKMHYYDWLPRILIFIGIFIVSFILLIIIGSFLGLSESYYFYLTPIPLIISSIIIELIDPNSRAFNFGFLIDKHTKTHIFQGFILVVATILIFLILSLISSGNFETYPLERDLLLSSLLFTLATAFTEELLFRGVIFQAIFARFGAGTAIFLSSLIFAVAHLFNPNISFLSTLNIFLAGILFGVIYVKTYSLWMAISFHFFWNLFLELFLGSRVSGINFGNTILYADLSKLPTWISGGNFGIEGSVITTFLLLAFMYYVFRYTPLSPNNSAGFYRKVFKTKEKAAPNNPEAARINNI